MAADWSRAVDIERLADAGERVDFDTPLDVFPRLAGELADATGRAVGHVAVTRERRQPVAVVSVQAVLPLVCQRCLRPVIIEVRSDARVALVADLDAADRLDSSVEPVVVEDGRVALRDLVEEELLLAVPLVPRHEDESQCGPAAVAETAAGTPSAGDPVEAISPDTQKPFAGLGELLKRGP
jgi:uncharacterized protein